MIMHPAHTEVRPLRRAIAVSLAAAAALAAGSANAFEFKLEGWDARWDTTVSYGQTYRVQSPDSRLIAVANGGTGRSANGDDGNLNYNTGMVSNTLKAVTELAVDGGDYGIFVRASAMYDHEVQDQPTQRTPISKAGKNLAGAYTRLLDAFAYARFDLGGHELDLRAGRLVANWGESTFIQGGINNAINHFDASALRVPGAELREAYLPQEMVKVSFAITPNLTAEGLYLFDWNETLPEPAGTYFGSTDLASAGSTKAMLGFGGISDLGMDFRPLGGPFISNYQAIRRLDTVEAKSSGQYGLSLKYFADNINDGTEFGLYFMNYHSKLPVVSGVTGSQLGIGNAIGGLTAVAAAAQALGSGLPFASAVTLATATAVSRAAAAGGNMSAATAQSYATYGANLALNGSTAVSQMAGEIAKHEYGVTTGYYTEYPEDIKMYGVSFNTQLGTTGVALQGEVSLRQDVPLQYDEVELLFAALAPFEQALFPVSAPGLPFPTTCGSIATVTRCGQLGSYGLNQRIQGWGEFDVVQGQVTATKAFPPMLGAQQLVAVLEAGLTHVNGMPAKLTGGPNGQGLRLNGPGTFVSGNSALAGKHDDAYVGTTFLEVEPQGRFADATSWGYRLATRLDYPNAIGAWNVSPRVVWAHDVSGTSPGPGGNFVEGRYAMTLGVAAQYQAVWEVDVAYTQYGGAGRWNEISDRDFIAAAVKYSF